MPKTTKVAVPVRLSTPIDLSASECTHGFVKFRLGHAPWGSFVVVDAIFTPRASVAGKWDFFLPCFYGPPFIAFGIGELGGDGPPHELTMSVDVCAPRGARPRRIVLKVGSDGQAKVYPDGAQLFRCSIDHDGPLGPHRAGSARQVGADFEVRVQHHTTRATIPLIRRSASFLGSPWNFQGTRRLTNVCYPYFTTLRRIRDEGDLNRIAMASQGTITLLGMAQPVDPVLDMRVYRSSTLDRDATIQVWLPVGLISPNHLLRFVPPDGAYYEVVLPEVVRVGLQPGRTLALQDDRVTADAGDLRTFDYVICGNASTTEGLAAPYDEENTRQVLHLENLQAEDIFKFWLRNMNTDQVTGRNPDPRLLETRP